MKKKSLARQFGLLFILFTLITIITSSLMTYMSKTNTYHKESVTNLQHITEFLSNIIQKDGDSFSVLIDYYKEHPESVKIPLDFRADLPVSEAAFSSYLAEHYAGKNFGTDITFSDLDDKGKQLYVIWRFEYYFTLFFDARDSFDISYVYFIFPAEDEDHVMRYMFDPTLELQKAEDGSEYIILEYSVYEDPEQHKYMWQAWESGEAPDGFDSLNNEFGYVYTYCRPVILNDEKAGLICAEISVDYVLSEILASVARQTLVSLFVLVVGIIVLYLLLKKHVLDRILSLEEGIVQYSSSKDPAIAEQILNGKGTNDELGSLAENSSRMITDLDEYMNNLQKITAEKERISAELNVATKIQADMLPRIFPQFPTIREFELFATMSPAKEVGGDFYDFFMVDDTHLAMVMADVSGKGVPAALFMVVAKTLIENRLRMGEAPAQALASVNNQLCENNESSLFVTVWLAIIDINTGHALEVNAGHEYPAIRRSGGSYELVKTKHSPAVAVMEDMRFRQTEFQLYPGDSLFVYTDGVTEATNADNTLFGDDRLLAALNGHHEDRPKDLLPAIRAAIDEFVADAPQFDDITMMSLLFHGKGTE